MYVPTASISKAFSRFTKQGEDRPYDGLHSLAIAFVPMW